MSCQSSVRTLPLTPIRRFATLILTIGAIGTSPVWGAPARGWAHAAGLETVGLNQPCAVRDASSAAVCVQQLLSRWGMAYDDARTDVIESLFTEDARFEVYLGNATPIVSVTGKAAILQNLQSAWAQQGDQRRHLISNVVVNARSADHMDANAYSLVGVAGDSPVLGTLVLYQATLQRTAHDVWRFSRLRIAMDSYAGKAPNTATPAGENK